jgi:hypothetical protein
MWIVLIIRARALANRSSLVDGCFPRVSGSLSGEEEEVGRFMSAL